MPYADKSKRAGYMRRYRIENRERELKRLRESNRRVRSKQRQIVQEAKAKPCSDCGKEFPYYVMDFDHREGKKFNVSQYSRVSTPALIQEIAKCDVVCSNCHRERTHNRTHSS